MATDTIRIWADARAIVGTLTADVYPFTSMTAHATGVTVSSAGVTGVYTFSIVSPTAGGKYRFILRDSGASPTWIGSGVFIAMNTGATIEELNGPGVDAVAWNSLPTVALPATPTNITAGTITTVTNLTNAPTAGDLTAAMKSSVTAAVPTVLAIQSGLATSTALASMQSDIDAIDANALTAMRGAVTLIGTISTAGTAIETFTHNGVTVAVTVDSSGNRSSVVIS